MPALWVEAHTPSVSLICCFPRDEPSPVVCQFVVSTAVSHASFSLLAESAPASLSASVRAAVDAGEFDARLARALLGVLEAGRVPLPDMVCGPDAVSAKVNDDGSVSVRATTPDGSAAFSFHLNTGGVVAEGGTLTLRGQTESLVGARARSGLHPFVALKSGGAHARHSSVLRLFLDGGQRLEVSVERGQATGVAAVAATIFDAAGVPAPLSMFSFAPTPTASSWTSLRTFNTYTPSIEMHCGLGDGRSVHVLVEPAVTASEILSLTAGGGHWLGRVSATVCIVDDGPSPSEQAHARAATHRLSGVGSLLLPGSGNLGSLDRFFKAVGAATRAAVVNEYPESISHAHAVEMFATNASTVSELEGADLVMLHKQIVAPVRHIVDAGGKSWRSYGLLAACDAVGGDAQRWTHYLALAELLHVGSLIIDDVQVRGRCSFPLGTAPL
jgi:hypothetical protein